ESTRPATSPPSPIPDSTTASRIEKVSAFGSTKRRRSRNQTTSNASSSQPATNELAASSSARRFTGLGSDEPLPVSPPPRRQRSLDGERDGGGGQIDGGRDPGGPADAEPTDEADLGCERTEHGADRVVAIEAPEHRAEVGIPLTQRARQHRQGRTHRRGWDEQ